MLGAAHRILNQKLQPASPEEIGEGILALAEVFRCEPPQGMAFTLYVGALSGVGVLPLQRALAAVVTSHRYPTMPLPADVLAAAAGPENMLRLFEDRFARATRLLS